MQNVCYLCILITIIPYERRSMQLYWLSDTIGVSDQISPEDVLELSSLGVKTVICNRPDRESESDQPDAESIRQACKQNMMHRKWQSIYASCQSRSLHTVVPEEGQLH